MSRSQSDDEEPTLEELTSIENCLIEASNQLYALGTTREAEREERLLAEIDSSLLTVQSWKELYNGYSNERPE
jgi:hypothetical protein